ncbi:MAG: hypothetical protein ACRC4M_03165 [Mycoplasma sp.]
MLDNIQENQSSFNLNFAKTQKLGSKQMWFIAKTSLIGGVGFSLIFAVGYLVYYFLQTSSSLDWMMLSIIGSVLLIVSIASSWIMSVGKFSYIKMLFCYSTFILSFGISFGFYFLAIGTATMFAIFGITAISMFIIAIISFFLKDKAMFTIQKISGIAMLIYFICFLFGLFFSFFFFQYNDWWEILVTALLSIIIIGSSLNCFWGLRKVSEFVTSSDEMTEEQSNLLKQMTWIHGFSVMSTTTMVFSYVLRLLLLIKSEQ